MRTISDLSLENLRLDVDEDGIATVTLNRPAKRNALDAATIAAYVAGGEPHGKAGAYAIQGGAECFVTHLAGSYSGVMGLPLHATARLLRAAGLMR